MHARTRVSYLASSPQPWRVSPPPRGWGYPGRQRPRRPSLRTRPCTRPGSWRWPGDPRGAPWTPRPPSPLAAGGTPPCAGDLWARWCAVWRGTASRCRYLQHTVMESKHSDEMLRKTWWTEIKSIDRSGDEQFGACLMKTQSLCWLHR